MGCAAALALRERGVRTLLLERAVPGAEASSAAAGILGGQCESRGPGPLADALLASRAKYAEWVTNLVSRTAIDVGYRVCGVLRVGDDASAQDDMTVEWQTKAGLRVEVLSGARAREIEPALSPEIKRATYFPDDGQVDPPRLLRALMTACVKADVEIRSGTTVERLSIESGRCVGVEANAERISSDAVVLAAGSWSSLVPGWPSGVPRVIPARGQMVLLDERAPRARTIVFHKSIYVVPRGDGRVVLGSTLEFAGYRKEVTAGGVAGILAGAIDAMPSLSSAELSATWSNFRPYVECAMPLVGASETPGLFLATGHHRNGILLAPWTADRVVASMGL